MVKVVQFLEIGNLPKSQLNPCRSRKVMIKNLNFQFQRADQRTIFTTFLNFLCRYPAPKTPPSLGCPQNRRNLARKMRANDRKLHSKIALTLHIIFSSSVITFVCNAHSQRACRAEKLRKNRRKHVRFSCKFS